ncbi:hypothetical protein ACIQ7D_10065 [Streptomyces sp. NPDC096310]|uniref:hypothetical protein n=1 Tax=Streptomyces sp. NPDC096310 TaxID=3366082 RepID=UPI00381CDCEA
MIVSFRVRPQAAAEFHHKGSGGPAAEVAQWLHAQLYGLPTAPDPLPTALDALLQATRTTHTGQQRAAIVRRVADQLRDGAEIIKGYQYRAQWERLPEEAAVHLRQAHDLAQQVADLLDQAAPHFHNLHAHPSRRSHARPVSTQSGFGGTTQPQPDVWLASAPPPPRRTT